MSDKNRARAVQFNFRLTAEEAELLSAWANKCGLSKSTYLLMLLHGYKPKELPPVEFHKLLNELSAIGRNLNQIAAKANTVGYINKEELLHEVDELKSLRTALEKELLSLEKWR